MLRTPRLTLRQVTETDGPGLFDIFGDDRVTEHYAWGALLARMGFTREGELRSRVLHRGAFHDVYIFGITRADWLAASGPAAR